MDSLHWVVGEESRALECIYARRIVFRAGKIFCAVIIFLGVRIGAEIMVERNVFLKNDDDMLD